MSYYQFNRQEILQKAKETYYLIIYLFVYLFIYLIIYLFIYLFIYTLIKVDLHITLQ